MRLRGRGGLALAVAIVVMAALPLVLKNAFALDILIRILLFAFIGTAWNLLGGYAKQLSLGHAAFFGLGAYTSTLLQLDFGVSPWIGMAAGGVVGMIASLPIGWLCFRLRGPYFTIATIATAQVLMLIFLKFRDFAWGAEGTTIPNLGNAPLMMQFEGKAPYYYIALGLLAAALAITAWVERSRVGYYLVALGEDEDAAEAVGIDVARVKRNIYMISSFLTALAGTFYTQYIYFIDPQTAFNFSVSIEAALVSIVGGIGTLWGPLIGTVLLETTSTLLQSWLGNSLSGVQLTVYSLILMAVILWRPTGIMGYVAEVYARHRAGPAKRRPRGRRPRHQQPRQALRRPARRPGSQLHRARKRNPRADRPERRGQDDRVQPHHGLSPARRGLGVRLRPGDGRPAAARRLRPRPCAHVPGGEAVRRHDGARQCDDRRLPSRSKSRRGAHKSP